MHQRFFGFLFSLPSSNPKHISFPWMGADQAARQGLCSSLLKRNLASPLVTSSEAFSFSTHLLDDE